MNPALRTPFVSSAFVFAILRGDEGFAFQPLLPLPRGRRLRALREAVGLDPSTVATGVGLPSQGTLLRIEEEEGLFAQAGPDERIYAVPYERICALYGAIESYIAWRAETGDPLTVEERPTSAEIDAAQAAEREAARQADPYLDLRRTATAAAAPGSAPTAEFSRVFSPAVAMRLLTEISELRAARA